MGRRVVLVVEDDAAIRQGIVDALGAAGYEARESDNGEDALQMALGGGIDLALLDVMMPGMDGFELLEQIRKSQPGLPVIMVTALGGEEDRIKGLKTGADDYVPKPFSAMELLARVEAVLRRFGGAARDRRDARVARAIRRSGAPRSSVRGRPDRGHLREGGRTAAVPGRLRGTPGRARRAVAARLGPRPARRLDAHDRHARRAPARQLGDDGNLIKTVRGRGYMLDAAQ